MNLFDLLPSPSALTDSDGFIIEGNLALAQFAGLNKHQMAGRHLDTLMTKSTQIFMQTHVWPLLKKDGRIDELHLRMTDATSNSKPVIATANAINENTRTNYCWVFCIAIERAKFEKELIDTKKEIELTNQKLWQAKKELQLSHDELERFTMTVSHDLKSPLISIRHFSKQLLAELQADLTDQQAHKFSRIEANINEMTQMMDELLLLARMTRENVAFDQVNLNDLLAALIARYEAHIEQANAEVVLSGTFPTLLSNKALLEQCFSNLLTNAILYRNPERRLKIDIQYRENGGYGIVDIIDNGAGISDHDKERIFTMFERASAVEGSGIGLAIVKTAMEKLNGQVHLTSKLGEGSTFSLHLPLQK